MTHRDYADAAQKAETEGNWDQAVALWLNAYDAATDDRNVRDECIRRAEKADNAARFYARQKSVISSF